MEVRNRGYDSSDEEEELMGEVACVMAQAAGVMAQVSAALANLLHTREPRLEARRAISHRGFVHLREKMEEDPVEFREVYRMFPDPFLKLCRIMRERGHMTDTRYVSVEEMMAVFLLNVGQDQRYSVTKDIFFRSKWTISRSFNKALDGLVALSPSLMAKPESSTPQKVMSDARYYPYFKDCIGAIDGTHIPAMVTGKDITRYRNRHGILSQNVLAACNFDLCFIYVLAGWEGSANDARVLKDAISRPRGLPLPDGKFYLVDCGYPNRKQFLAPYRGTRYHLKEYGAMNNRSRPRNPKEIFNLRHASLRNAIERLFGIFKSRFPLFKGQHPGFPYSTQVKLVWACAGLHNYLRRECATDEFPVLETTEDDQENVPGNPDDYEMQTEITQRAAATAWRDSLAEQMWGDATRATTGV